MQTVKNHCVKRAMLLLVATAVLTGFAKAQGKSIELTQKWELAGLENPESVIFDNRNKVLYVSNVNGQATDKDGNGYISIVSPEGEMMTQKWIEGLNAPKGMGIYKGMLYVTDIDEIVEIDIASGKITQRYKAEEATFLNDIAIDSKGTVYVSNTFGFSGIYRLYEGSVTLWLKYESLNMPNGLLIDGKKLILACWGEQFNPETFATGIPGKIMSVDLKTLQTTNLSEPIGNLDGLEKFNKGYLVTDWYDGKLWYWDSVSKKAIELLDLPMGSADLLYESSGKMICIPLMNDNKLVAYTLKK